MIPFVWLIIVTRHILYHQQPIQSQTVLLVLLFASKFSLLYSAIFDLKVLTRSCVRFSFGWTDQWASSFVWILLLIGRFEFNNKRWNVVHSSTMFDLLLLQGTVQRSVISLYLHIQVLFSQHTRFFEVFFCFFFLSSWDIRGFFLLFGGKKGGVL